MSRPRRYKRLIRGLAAALILLGVLHSSPFRRVIAEQLERSASRAITGSVTIGSLDYAIWRASFDLAEVEFSGPGISGRVERATATWSLSTGVAIKLAHPELHATTAGTSNSPVAANAQPWAPLLDLGRLKIVSGAVRLDLDDAVLDLRGVSGQLTRRGLSTGGRVEVAEADASWRESDIAISGLSLSAHLNASSERLELTQISIEALGLDLAGNATVRVTNPLLASARASLPLVDPPDERLRRLNLQPEVAQRLVYEAYRSAQHPARRGEHQDVIHVANEPDAVAR